MSLKHSLSLASHLEMALVSTSDGLAGTTAIGRAAPTWI
jgi:hypothetical protein